MKKIILLLLLIPVFSFGQVVNTFPWTNNFEGNIPLEQDPNDDGDWLLKQGQTPSFNSFAIIFLVSFLLIIHL